MKKFLLVCVLLIMSNFAIGQQYKSHTVTKGENVYRIAKRYNTTPEAIYNINPTAKDGIKEGQILAIPVVDDQEYKTHVVEKDDTVYNLSKKYNTTPEVIYSLNPEAVNGINLGQVLRVGKIEKKVEEDRGVEEQIQDGKSKVLDSLKVIPAEKKIVRYITHKVRRKETLYGIAKKYNITVEDIKKENKRLYSEQIKKKDKIRIPVFAKVETPVEEVKDSIVNRLSVTTTYIIKPKDTRYSIAHRHGITIGELERLNPNIDPNLQIGTEIIVPTTVFVPVEETLESGFELYTVPPKETIFNILRNTGISADSLMTLNPFLAEGLKEGIVITIPKKDTLALDIPQSKYLTLEDKLSNFAPKKLTVMLPFTLDTLNAETRQQTAENLKKRQSLRIALDLYSGILIAVDSARVKGITTELNVFDTKKNNNKGYITKLINENNFDEADAVIGPLFQNNLETVAEALNKYNTPVFSPASKRESNLLYDNFFQTRPTSAVLQDKIIAFVEKDSTDKNIVIIVQQSPKFEALKAKLTAKFPKAKIAKIEEGNYLYEVHLNKVLDGKRPNWVFLESDDVAMISNVTPLLNAKAESHKITLFTTDKNTAFDDDSIKNEQLSKLHMHYPSLNKEFDKEEVEGEKKPVSSYVKRYMQEYGIEPNNWAVRGFDITYDILMRLGTADDLYHSVSFEGVTEYEESKFNYIKKVIGGYYNNAAYLIKFDNDLKLTLVE